MHALPRNRPSTATAPALISKSVVIFLSGLAWDHPEISFAIRTDALNVDLARAVVWRAVQNWNAGFASSPMRRLRDFRLVPANNCAAPDIEIRLRSGTDTADGMTELASRRDGTIAQALVRLTWPAPERPDDLGLLATTALRGLGRALGVGHASDPSDPMYPAFNGVKLHPSRWDVLAFAAVEEWYLVNSPFFYPPRGYSFC
jgi:hypothetical protein